MSTKATIQCPNCHAEIDVNEILYHQLEDELKQKNIAEQKKLRDEVEAKRREYKKAFDGLKAQELIKKKLLKSSKRSLMKS